jgi:hypothetical protein
MKRQTRERVEKLIRGARNNAQNATLPLLKRAWDKDADALEEVLKAALAAEVDYRPVGASR